MFTLSKREVPAVSLIYTHSSAGKKNNRKAARGGLTEASRCWAERMSWANTREDKAKLERASRNLTSLEYSYKESWKKILSQFLYSIYFHFQEEISQDFWFENTHLYYNCLRLLTTWKSSFPQFAFSVQQYGETTELLV